MLQCNSMLTAVGSSLGCPAACITQPQNCFRLQSRHVKRQRNARELRSRARQNVASQRSRVLDYGERSQSNVRTAQLASRLNVAWCINWFLTPLRPALLSRVWVVNLITLRRFHSATAHHTFCRRNAALRRSTMVRTAGERGPWRSVGSTSSSCGAPAACSDATKRAVWRKCTFSSSSP